MTTTRPFAAVLACAAIAVTACGGGDAGPPMVVVRTAAGMSVLDGDTGVLGPASPAASTPDGSVLARGVTAGGRTTVQAVELATDEVRWDAVVEGTFEPRVAAADGRRVAMTPPTTGGRLSTEVVIADADGNEDRYKLPGFFEPEAFSLDGTALFVVSYLPPRAPVEYQVRRLDLASGEVGDVFSVDAELQDAMQGTARTQVWGPDGSRLYTLYTQQVDTRTVAFVHVLDLEEQWAHCIDLPAGFTAAAGGLGLADDGRLYAVDATAGMLAEVDTERLAVAREAAFPRDRSALTSSVAVVGDELLVGAGTAVLRVDREDLDVVGTLPAGGAVVGVQRSTSPGELYVALEGEVVLLDLDSGEAVRRTGVGPSAPVLSFGGAAVPGYAGFSCAC